MDPTQASGVVLALILTEVCKPVVPAKFYPLVAMVVGVLWQLVLNVPTNVAGMGSTIVAGVISGLTAAGLYAAGKHVVSTPAPKKSAPAAAKAS